MKIINPKDLLLKPEKFLDKKSLKVADLTKYIAVISLIPAIAFTVAISAGIRELQSIPMVSMLSLEYFGAYTGAVLAIAAFITVIIGSLISFFIGGAILHLFALGFGGKKKYQETLNAVAASITPTILLGWIPFVSIWTLIQSTVVMVLGISKKQKLPIFKSALTIAIPIIILLAIVPLYMFYNGMPLEQYAALITQMVPVTLMG